MGPTNCQHLNSPKPVRFHEWTGMNPSAPRTAGKAGATFEDTARAAGPQLCALAVSLFARPVVSWGSHMTDKPRILYCHCQYAQIVPKEVKEAVLKRLCDSGAAFDAVADLCEMSARQDPSLKRLAEGGAVKIAACYPRAVKWLFHTAKADLPPGAAEVLNMRVQSAEEVCAALFDGEVKPNLPAGKVTARDVPKNLAAEKTA